MIMFRRICPIWEKLSLYEIYNAFSVPLYASATTLQWIIKYPNSLLKLHYRFTNIKRHT